MKSQRTLNPLTTYWTNNQSITSVQSQDITEIDDIDGNGLQNRTNSLIQGQTFIYNISTSEDESISFYILYEEVLNNIRVAYYHLSSKE